jgi:phenylacetate-coenzyme A ligase PaaK-like adenylate-forming protein
MKDAIDSVAPDAESPSAPAQCVAISNAEPLSDLKRERISSAFRRPVRDTYGMAEPLGHLHPAFAGLVASVPAFLGAVRLADCVADDMHGEIVLVSASR